DVAVRERPQPLLVRAGARDDDAERRLAPRRFDQQVEAFRAIEPADREDEAFRLRGAIVECLRRVRQQLRLDAVEALQAIRDVARGREHAARLAQRDRVEPRNCLPRRAVERRLVVLAEIGAVVVVGLEELVQHPGDLVRVTHAVRGELRRDDAVDRPAVGLGQVDEPPQECLVEHARLRIPLERHGDELRLVPSRPERPDEIVRHHLGAAPHERHLRRRDDDPHLTSSCEMRSSRSSISFNTASLNARWSAKAGSTYHRIRRRRTFLIGPPLPTIGRSAEIGQSRSAWSRIERRTCAGGTPSPRGPAAWSSSFSRAKRAATSVGSSAMRRSVKSAGYGAVWDWAARATAREPPRSRAPPPAMTSAIAKSAGPRGASSVSRGASAEGSSISQPNAIGMARVAGQVWSAVISVSSAPQDVTPTP